MEKTNTNRELWREKEGDFYSDSIHLTAEGMIGMNCGGRVVEMPIEQWVSLAPVSHPLEYNIKEIKSKFHGFVPSTKDKVVFYWFYNDMNLGNIMHGPFDTEEECGIAIKNFGWWGYRWIVALNIHANPLFIKISVFGR
jgi:hypothetical protein